MRVVWHPHTRNWHRPGSLVVFGGTLSRRQGSLLLFCLVFCFFFQLSCRFLVFASRSAHFSHSHLVDLSKRFTNVTKTIANSTTFSRKPGDYNGTIIFEFDIMKNSSALNLKLTFFATVKSK